MTEPSTTERRTPANPIGNGGRIKTLTRDTSKESMVAVLDAIRQRHRFLLTSHARPDGDAVGSLLALWMTLNAMGKQAEMQLRDPVPVIYGTLPAADQIRQFAHLQHGRRGGIDRLILARGSRSLCRKDGRSFRNSHRP